MAEISTIKSNKEFKMIEIEKKTSREEMNEHKADIGRNINEKRQFSPESEQQMLPFWYHYSLQLTERSYIVIARRDGRQSAKSNKVIQI